MVLLEDTIINSLKRIVVQDGNLFSTTPSFILTPICKKKFLGKIPSNVLCGIFICLKKIIKLTESDLTRIVKRVINEGYSLNFKRRFKLINDVILELIDSAKDEVDEDDFNGYYDYLENVVYWVVQELQSMYGDKDDFWYDYEDEIIEYIKDEYDEYLE
jgi:hypothetical protein